MTRAYFRIQEKHPICSKRASYFGNISWFASSTLKNLWKVSVAICKHFMIYRSCLQFLIFSQRFWENLVMVETEIWRFFGLLFQENYKDAITELWNIHKNWKNYVKICPLLLGSKKNFIILRIHFLQKINVGRENTSSQWLISFRKYNPVNCFYKPKETLIISNWRINVINWRTEMMLRKGFYHYEKWKINWKFQHLFKADHSRPSIVPLRVSPRVSVALVFGQPVLHWGHTNAIMCIYGGLD